MRLGVAVVGGPETVAAKLAALLREVEVDEVILVSDLFRHADRLRSYEIAMRSVRDLRAPLES
jgi:alkanesulfonate monooxygenase SsuD/methylene tetrahydromethanopterin reductase-like flavin-dependent oxidoreductase (luciferase family)